MINVLISPDDRESAAALRQTDARILVWPEARISDASDQVLLDNAIDSLFGYDWLIFKNEYAAEFFLLRLLELKHRTTDLDDVHVVAIGDATAAKLVDAQVHVDLAIPRAEFDSLVTLLGSYVGGKDSISGLNLLVPCAGINHEPFEKELEQLGARVDSVTAYKTTSDSRGLSQMNAMFAGGAIDVVIFLNSQAINDLTTICDTDNLTRLLAGAAVLGADRPTVTAAMSFGLRATEIANNLVEVVRQLPTCR